MNRLDVRKTYKLYIGGSFVRSESGRYLPAQSAGGAQLDNFCHASRKDFRDAVVAARTAFEGWGKRSAYLRGQILYRAAEMLQNRAAELVTEIARSTNSSPAQSRREVSLAIDRLVYFAGWTDKYSHIFGHMDVNAIVDGSGIAELKTKLQGGTALNLKRYADHSLTPASKWLSERAEDPYWILDTIEFKTAWHPIGL